MTEQSESRATGVFHASAMAPELLEHWPADFRLSVTYELSGNCLSAEIAIENPGDSPLPYGFGAHPYFRVPLASGGSADACRVRLPARQVVVLEDMLPTQRRAPATGDHGLSQGLAFADTPFDDVFTDLQFDDGYCEARIDDPGSGRAVSIRFDENFSECVVYNPPHREAICLEPYTCVPGLFGEQGGVATEQALRVLPAGASARARFVIEAL